MLPQSQAVWSNLAQCLKEIKRAVGEFPDFEKNWLLEKRGYEVG